ncbi:sodium:alanine symporter, partial [Clostridium perfringens]
IYLSCRTRFLQIRQVKEMSGLAINRKKSEKGISSFQALSVSLAGRIGTGNIAGVGTACHS